MVAMWITSDLFLNTIGIIAIFLLVGLLLVKEFVRTAAPAEAPAWLQNLNYAIWLLLFVFGLVILGRLMQLLGQV